MGVEPLYSTISIHAPRGGSDNALRGLVRVLNNFNPRSPWGERPLASGILMMARLFQSTLPVGGATGTAYHLVLYLADFNPRSPWGERPGSTTGKTAGGRFQSTLPVGGATTQIASSKVIRIISIHAPRGGSDLRFISKLLSMIISIHAPRGGSDRTRICPLATTPLFQSTLPVGGATPRRIVGLTLSGHFNPRSPWGERLDISFVLYNPIVFQSTLPVGGATRSEGR